MRRAALATLLLPALLLGPTACGFKREPLEARADRFPVEAVDATGETVTVAHAPRRIVTSDAAAAGVLAALHPVAPVRTVPAGDVARLAGADVVVVPDAPGSDAAGSVDPDAAVFHYGAARFDDIPVTVANLGLAVGRGPEGVALARRLRAGLDAVRRRAATLPRVRVFIDAGALSTLGAGRPLAEAVQLAGGRLISTRSRPVTLAELRRFDPQVWLVLPASGSTVATLRRRPDTRTITAVRRGRLVRVDERDYAPTPELPQRLDRLVRLLHPTAS